MGGWWLQDAKVTCTLSRSQGTTLCLLQLHCRECDAPPSVAAATFAQPASADGKHSNIHAGTLRTKRTLQPPATPFSWSRASITVCGQTRSSSAGSCRMWGA